MMLLGTPWRAPYLGGGHVGDGAVRLDALELLEAPVELLEGLERQPRMVVVSCKDWKKNSKSGS